MAKKKKQKLVNPSGLSISRNGGTYTFSWKRGSNYSQQQLQWSNGGAWRNLGVGAGTTSASVSLGTGGSFTTVWFRVRGKLGKSWSSWITYSLRFYAPAMPTGGASVMDEFHRTKFSWNVSVANNNRYPFNRVEWQSILVKDCEVTDGSKLGWSASSYGWQTGTSGVTTDGAVYITELSGDVTEDKSATRWFRIRSVGSAGASGWRYIKRIFAKPLPITIIEGSATQETSATYLCRCAWDTAQSASRPISNLYVQYAIAQPTENMGFSGNWEDATTSMDTAGTDYSVFTVDGTVGKDQCIFVRANGKYSDKITYGHPYIVYYGELKSPTITNVQSDPTTHKVIVSATNTSDVPDSFLAVIYRDKDNPDASYVCGVIPHGETEVMIQCPEWESTPAFGVYAVAGSYEAVERADGVDAYNVIALMKSEEVWRGGDVPVAPENVGVEATPITGTIRVTWDWTWEEADSAVIAWSDHEDAWESTDEPEEYTISSLHASRWNISGLATGKTWYVAVKLVRGEVSGPWSNPVSLDLTSAPAVPVLTPSSNVISSEGDVTLYWSYVSTDGTGQSYAEICEAIVNGENISYKQFLPTEDIEVNETKTYYNEQHIPVTPTGEENPSEEGWLEYKEKILAHTTTEQQVTLNAKDVGWGAGETKYLCVRVTSASGKRNDKWSTPLSIIVAERIEASIASTSLVEATQTYTSVDEEGIEHQETRTYLKLDEMPLTVNVTGAGAGGETTITVARTDSYHVERPDESEFYGYEGETIATDTFSGDGSATFRVADLIGSFDDSAKYIITATVKDSYGQTDSASVEFEVEWNHQASAPSEATVEIDEENLIAKLSATAPSDALATDTVDIYRLSADKPELIVKGGAFGTLYVDPYPAINGGYRFVTVTADGDYIAPDNIPAWLDMDSEWDYDHSIIDFNGQQVLLYYNIDVSNNWEKGFHSTRYLGGAVKGDWDAGIVRTSTVSTVAFTKYNADVIEGLRDLAEYSGICQIRTLDGSSYSADLQVQEDRDHSDYGTKTSFSISGTKVDPEEPVGLTFEQWNEGNQ